MESNITPEQRKRMEDFLKEHPIDPSYDEECELFDGTPPPEQATARRFQFILDRCPESATKP